MVAGIVGVADGDGEGEGMLWVSAGFAVHSAAKRANSPKAASHRCIGRLLEIGLSAVVGGAYPGGTRLTPGGRPVPDAFYAIGSPVRAW